MPNGTIDTLDYKEMLKEVEVYKHFKEEFKDDVVGFEIINKSRFPCDEKLLPFESVIAPLY